MKKIADLPSSEGTPINGVQPGPRGFRWRPDQPATVTWVEALDEGNPRNNVPFRDRIVALAAPFSGTPVELARTEWRFGGLSYTEKGIGLLTESDRRTRHTRTWILEAGAQPRKLWDRRQQDAYGNPGSPILRRDTAMAGGRGQTRRRRPGRDSAAWGLYLPDRNGRVAGGRSAVPRSARPEDTQDRAALPLSRKNLRVGHRAAR